MKLNYYFLFVLLLLSSTIVYSQTVDISAEIRPRYEFRNGYKTLTPDGVDAANFISQRTRLNAFYGNTQFKAKLVLQDVRTWGDVSQLNTSDVNSTAIHEAWGEIIFNEFIALKAGRQEIAYDDQRIFGSVGWAQQARSHDAAILKITPSKKHRVDIGLALNANGESLFKTDYTVNSYKTIQYAWYHGKFNKAGLSFLFLNNGMAYDKNTPSDTTQKVAYSQTFGPRFTYGSEVVKFNAAFYYQMGKNKHNNDLSAIYFTANISYAVNKKFDIGIGGEYLSGTESKNQLNPNEDDMSFKPFYGTNHKFNGWMDYFYVGSYMYSNSNGLIDINLPLIYKIDKLTLKLIPHYFMAAATVATNQNGSWKDYDNALGTEIDFTAVYSYSKSVAISCGYSQMFGTETLQVIKGGNYENTSNWAWVMLTFKPTFFKSK